MRVLYSSSASSAVAMNATSAVVTAITAVATRIAGFASMAAVSAVVATLATMVTAEYPAIATVKATTPAVTAATARTTVGFSSTKPVISSKIDRHATDALLSVGVKTSPIVTFRLLEAFSVMARLLSSVAYRVDASVVKAVFSSHA